MNGQKISIRNWTNGEDGRVECNRPAILFKDYVFPLTGVLDNYVIQPDKKWLYKPSSVAWQYIQLPDDVDIVYYGGRLTLPRQVYISSLVQWNRLCDTMK